MNSPERNADLRYRVIRQLLMHIEDEHMGASESLMKEVWEDCYDEEDREVVKAELERVGRIIDSHRDGECP